MVMCVLSARCHVFEGLLWSVEQKGPALEVSASVCWGSQGSSPLAGMCTLTCVPTDLCVFHPLHVCVCSVMCTGCGAGDGPVFSNPHLAELLDLRAPACPFAPVLTPRLGLGEPGWVLQSRALCPWFPVPAPGCTSICADTPLTRPSRCGMANNAQLTPLTPVSSQVCPERSRSILTTVSREVSACCPHLRG